MDEREEQHDGGAEQPDSPAPPGPPGTGFIAWFAGNRVAANLVMVLVLAGGIISMLQMRMEVFPEVDVGRVTVRVPYLGASPEEVEEGVVVRVEEAIAGIEGIERITSVSREGVGTVVAELEDYASTRAVLSDIEAAVDRIDTFPEEIEEPIISEVSNRVQVISVVLHGDVPERALKVLAERVRDDLTVMGEISQVSIAGLRRYEISIEVSEEALRRYGLSFGRVAEAVRRASLDLPGGSIETGGGEVLIRTQGQRYTGEQFERIIVLSQPDGTVVRLGQIAEVIDGFADTDTAAYFDGERAAVLNVFRVGEQDAIEVADLVTRYVEEKRAELPAGVAIDTWFDRSEYLRSRIDLLINNALIGLVLVFLCLLLFLDLRLAFWTTMGIPISFLGAFWLLPFFGVTINMLSLFAFIIVLGVVVDDAIVVGENIFAYRQRGMDPLRAAVRGAQEMAAPVIFAILTTVVAFLPLLFTSGEIGELLTSIPIVVISVLLLSLVEALVILPAHLSGRSRGAGRDRLAGFHRGVQRQLDRFIRGPYVALLRRAVAWRYATAAIAVSILIATLGYVAGGHLKFVFFPEVDADNIVAELTMPQGTPAERTEAVVRRIERAAQRVRQRLDERRADDLDPFRHISTTIGQQPFRAVAAGESAEGTEAPAGQSHLAEINVELLPSERRHFSSDEIAGLWREEVGRVPGVSSLVFLSSFFSAGEAVHVELAHHDFQKLLAAAQMLKAELGQFVGVSDIQDSFEPGKREIKVSLKPEARNLGLTRMDLARQVRQGFYGAEAQRIQRGRHDVKVMVRYPEAERRSIEDIETMRIRLPDGTEVPFHTVAELRMGRGYAAINRSDRRRVVSVTADVDESVASSNRINSELVARVLPRLQRELPGLSYRFEGEQKEQQESLSSLAINFTVALGAIFALLGIQFRSYVQPLIVMSAIPFGLVGAVVGHVLMGMNLSFLSAFGIVALTGVVVNDALIMIDLINRERAEGVPLSRVIVDSGVRRFRPIMLTTLTTFCGLTPMLLEQSLQAKFLIPMAISLAFGVLFATAITLLLVPTLYMILEDGIGAVQRFAARGEATAIPSRT